MVPLRPLDQYHNRLFMAAEAASDARLFRDARRSAAAQTHAAAAE
jgi:hypothetical protein